MEFISASVEIDLPVHSCYQPFKTLEIYARIGIGVENVSPTDIPNGWAITLRSPSGKTMTLLTEIDTLIPNQLISWHSMPDSPFQTVGRVILDALTAHRTVLTLSYDFVRPTGAAAQIFQELYGDDPGWLVQAETQALKQVLEASKVVPLHR